MSQDTKKALIESFLIEEGDDEIDAQPLLCQEALLHCSEPDQMVQQGMSAKARRDLISWARSAHEPYAISSDFDFPAFVNLKQSIERVSQLSEILESNHGGEIKMKSLQPTSKLSGVPYYCETAAVYTN